jgi:hypothetical protein
MKRLNILILVTAIAIMASTSIAKAQYKEPNSLVEALIESTGYYRSVKSIEFNERKYFIEYHKGRIQTIYFSKDVIDTIKPNKVQKWLGMKQTVRQIPASIENSFMNWNLVSKKDESADSISYTFENIIKLKDEIKYTQYIITKNAQGKLTGYCEKYRNSSGYEVYKKNIYYYNMFSNTPDSCKSYKFIDSPHYIPKVVVVKEKYVPIQNFDYAFPSLVIKRFDVDRDYLDTH